MARRLLLYAPTRFSTNSARFIRSAPQPRPGLLARLLGGAEDSGASGAVSLHFFDAGAWGGSCMSSSAVSSSLQRRDFPENWDRLGDVFWLDRLVCGESSFCAENTDDAPDWDEVDETEGAPEPGASVSGLRSAANSQRLGGFSGSICILGGVFNGSQIGG